VSCRKPAYASACSPPTCLVQCSKLLGLQCDACGYDGRTPKQTTDHCMRPDSRHRCRAQRGTVATYVSAALGQQAIKTCMQGLQWWHSTHMHMVCTLPPTYGTDVATDAAPADPCAGRTCSGRGTCSNGVCQCQTGWTGTNCETATSTPPTGESGPCDIPWTTTGTLQATNTCVYVNFMSRQDVLNPGRGRSTLCNLRDSMMAN
jgi:hypothetical protein